MCVPDCRFCRLAPRLSHDEQVIATLRRDVAVYRRLAQLAVAQLAGLTREVSSVRNQLAESRDEVRRYTRLLVGGSEP